MAGLVDVFGRPINGNGQNVRRTMRFPATGPVPKSVNVLDERVRDYVASDEDPALKIHGMPPNRGRFVMPHVQTFQGLFGTFSRAYRPSDEALNDSIENARNMRNDVGITECVEARQRGTALLDWQIVPEDEDSDDQRQLCTEIEKIIRNIRRFTEYRRCLMEAIWFGRYGIQNRWAWNRVQGKMRVMPTPLHDTPGWLPLHGDKIVFRYDDGTYYETNSDQPAYPHQCGILIGSRFQSQQTKKGKWTVEPTGRGLAYFMAPWERRLLTIHKHMIEDGPWEFGLMAGGIHGVGIRSKIYWEWLQKQEFMAYLVSYLERSAGGIEIWSYPAGAKDALDAAKQAAEERLSDGRNIIFFPKPLGDDGTMYDVQVIEPGFTGIELMHKLLTDYFGHRMKRYILGQILTTEAEATGLGSGVAELHLDSYLQIVKYDATNLEETLTAELVEPIKNWNFPRARSINVRFVINTESPDVEKKLESWARAYEMGAGLVEREVIELVGASMPQEGDNVLKQQDPNAMGQMPGGGQAVPNNGTPVQPMGRDESVRAVSDAVHQRMFGDDYDSVTYATPEGDTVHHVNEEIP